MCPTATVSVCGEEGKASLCSFPSACFTTHACSSSSHGRISILGLVAHSPLLIDSSACAARNSTPFWAIPTLCCSFHGELDNSARQGSLGVPLSLPLFSSLASAAAFLRHPCHAPQVPPRPLRPVLESTQEQTPHPEPAQGSVHHLRGPHLAAGAFRRYSVGYEFLQCHPVAICTR